MESVAELSVLLVYGSDPAWDSQDRAESDRESRRLACAMRRQGHSVSLLSVCDANLRQALSAYEPAGVLVFNWCEGLPGVHHSEALVAETLERLRFTYTGSVGADPPALLRQGPGEEAPPDPRAFPRRGGCCWPRPRPTAGTLSRRS